MKKYLDDIREKTSGMSRKDTCAYVITYYWYHILGAAAAIIVILIFAGHYAFGNKKPLFTCVIVNQEADASDMQRLKEAFAEKAGLPKDRVEIDPDYHFSYGSFHLEGANESSYEKFFFRWRSGEIDAAILPEEFYRHCREMGGGFRALDEEETEGLETVAEEGKCMAVILGDDPFMEKAFGRKGEKLLLAFPESGKNTEAGREFLRYIKEEGQ